MDQTNAGQGRLFVTNRPNYCHKRFAETVGCDFYHVKHYISESIPGISLPFNGMLNARRLPQADVYFAESIMDYYPVYYRNKGKKIMLIAEDTLFKLPNMPKFKQNYILKMLRSADGFMAISDLCKDMMLKHVDKPIRVAYPFPHRHFFHVNSKHGTKNVLFVGRDDKTKGFPELVEAIKLLRKKDDWNLFLIGECSRSVKKEDGINPLGYVKDMQPYFQKCSFFAHPAYFDPCPATIFEGMNAGMITVISKNIGQSTLFKREGFGNLILKDSHPQTIAAKLEELSSSSQAGTSSRLRSLSRQFTEGKRLKLFKKEFEALLEEI